MIDLCFVIDSSLWMTSNHRLFWADKARRTDGLRGYACIEGRNLINRERLERPVFTRCTVTVTVAYPLNQRADPANTSPVVKALLDGLTDAGFWPDDDSEHVVAVTYRRDPEKSRRGTHKVTLTITEADE